MADLHSSTDPAAPSETNWAYVPKSPASARLMVRRARAAGRTLAPAIYELAGEPPEPAPPTDASPTDTPPLILSPPKDPDATPARAPEPPPDSDGVFTLERRVRFLDHLAVTGNARAAAALAGVSHATAYRTRRQDCAFAGLWDAALVHARDHGSDVLATRALDGVTSEVWYHGEVVGTRVHHDPRLLLAHLARLDRRVEGDTAALARAARFDELLAGYAGVEQPDGFDLAAEAACDPVPLPPTRDGYVRWLRNEVIDDFEQQSEVDEQDEDEDGACEDAAEAPEWLEAAAEAEQEAGAAWDDWHAEGRARVAAILGQAQDERGPASGPDPTESANAPSPPTSAHPEPVEGEPVEGPIEVKSAPRVRRSAFCALDTAQVSHPRPCARGAGFADAPVRAEPPPPAAR